MPARVVDDCPDPEITKSTDRVHDRPAARVAFALHVQYVEVYRGVLGFGYLVLGR
jgi:hypothetical protein